MEIIEDPHALQAWSLAARRAGEIVGFVPTMGALHDGHLSLIKRSGAECARTVVSIFVNPTQFGPGEDFDRYPRPIADDTRICSENGVDVVFTPTTQAMYPAGAATVVSVGPPLTSMFEATARPGHFDGVATVVTKLLNAALPNRLYIGHKDAQQSAVIRRLVWDLGIDVEVVVCPVVRDPDGLAISSRNRYLSTEERQAATAIPRALEAARRAFAGGEMEPGNLVNAVRTEIARSQTITMDYVAVVDPTTFMPTDIAGEGCEIVIAAKVGSTRLIDVISLIPPK